jgi:hypothetical protein
LEVLKKLGVRRVVNCTETLENYHERKVTGGGGSSHHGGSCNQGSYKKVSPKKQPEKQDSAHNGEKIASKAEDGKAEGGKAEGGKAESKTDKSGDKTGDSPITYLRFPISLWQRYVLPENSDKPVKETDASIFAFFKPLFDYVDTCLKEGESVLIHCLAGAHRAGTAGIVLLIRYTDQESVESAVVNAKRLRSIVDPIGSFMELLKRYWGGRERGGEGDVDV